MEGLGQGMNAFAQNFMQGINAGQDRRQRQQELDAMNALRQMQIEAAQREAEKENDLKFGMANLRGQVNLPGLMKAGIIDPSTQSSDPVAMKQVAMGQIPQGMEGMLSEPTLQDQVKMYASVYPKEGLPMLAEASKTKLAFGVEERYDPKTKTTYGKDYIQDEKTGKKSYISEERPIKGRESTNINIGSRGEITDKDILAPQIKQLPKLKSEAQVSSRRYQLYKDLTGVLDKGAGGLVPGLKGILSPALEALGMDSKIESEAQAYQLMARAGVGSMRLALVGSGQVSNYEQDLMQRLSGGSIKTSREAAKSLFKYYMAESKRVVDDYNNTINDLSSYDGKIGKVYKTIPMDVNTEVKQQESLTSLPPASSYTGKTVKRSDGIRLKSDGKNWNIVRE